MKTIGLLGGMSWESTARYYAVINRTVAERLGGLHSAEILLASIDFHPIEVLQREGAWDRAGDLLAARAEALEIAGADLLVMCTNTMHRVASSIEERLSIPFLHVADATGEQIAREGLGSVGLLGTRFTMEQSFYLDRLRDRFGLRVVVPFADDRIVVDRVIYEELCRGKIHPSSRRLFREVIGRLVDRKIEGVILGCTEIGLLLGPKESPVPVFDTADIHARTAAELALEGEPAGRGALG